MRRRALMTAPEVAVRAVLGYNAHKCSLFAAGITYYALFSLFPMLLFGLGVAGFVLTDEASRRDLVDNLLDFVPLTADEGRDNLEEVINSVVSARGTLGIVGLVGSAWAGSALFTAVRRSLNSVFGVEQPRPFVLGKAIDIAWVLGFGSLVTFSVAVTLSAVYAEQISDELLGAEAAELTSLLISIAYRLIPVAASFTVFFLIYAVIARTDIPWRYVWPGALVAMAAFESLKFGFSWYLSEFSNFNATYGSLGFIVALLFFIFLSAQIMLLGAEVTRANYEVATRRPASDDHETALGELGEKIVGLVGRLPVLGSRLVTSTDTGDGPATRAMIEDEPAASDTPAPGPRRRGGDGAFGSVAALAGLVTLAIVAWSALRPPRRT